MKKTSFAILSLAFYTALLAPLTTTADTFGPYAYYNENGKAALTGYIEGSYTFTVTDGKATIRDFDTAHSGELSITNTLGGYIVTRIGINAFFQCPKLTKITIPAGVTAIEEQAFEECTNLTSMTIPDSVTTIGNHAFRLCTSLTSVTICTGVTAIGRSAFDDCTSLTSVYFAGNAPTPGSPLFSENSSTVVYFLPGTTGWGATYAGRPTAVWQQQAP